MSRREIAVNTILGLFLLVAFAAPIVLAIFAIGFLGKFAQLAVETYFPDLTFSRIDALGIYWLIPAAIGARCLWKKLWLNACLSLSIIVLAILQMQPTSTSGDLGIEKNWILPVMIVIGIPTNRRLRFWEFASGSFLLILSFLVVSHFFGLGNPDLAARSFLL